MNSFEQQRLAVIRSQYPRLFEVTGSFKFDCSYQHLDGEWRAGIPFGEWRWYFRDKAPSNTTNPEWLSWFKYHLIDDLELYLAFRLREHQETNPVNDLEHGHEVSAAMPHGGRADFVYGKLSLHWFGAKLPKAQCVQRS